MYHRSYGHTLTYDALVPLVYSRRGVIMVVWREIKS